MYGENSNEKNNASVRPSERAGEKHVKIRYFGKNGEKNLYDYVKHCTSTGMISDRNWNSLNLALEFQTSVDIRKFSPFSFFPNLSLSSKMGINVNSRTCAITGNLDLHCFGAFLV